jgi:hypothetical protein
MVSNPTISCLAIAEKPNETNIPLNVCSRIRRGSCPTPASCGDRGCYGHCDARVPRPPITRFSIVEMRRQHIVDIAVHVAHIRELEAGV